MKEVLLAITSLGYCAVIGYGCYIAQSAWPLIFLLLVPHGPCKADNSEKAKTD